VPPTARMVAVVGAVITAVVAEARGAAIVDGLVPITQRLAAVGAARRMLRKRRPSSRRLRVELREVTACC
jgi:hypothetical protein